MVCARFERGRLKVWWGGCDKIEAGPSFAPYVTRNIISRALGGCAFSLENEQRPLAFEDEAYALGC